MLSRLFHRYSNFRTIALIASNPPLLPSVSPSFPLPNLGSSNPNLGSLLGYSSRTFSSDRKDNGGEKVGSQSWSFSLENDDANAVFGLEEGDMAGISDETIAASASGRSSVKKVEDEGWETAEGYKPWSFEDEANGEVEKVFDVGNVEMEGLSISGDEVEEPETRGEDKELEREEQELTIKMKGPNRAFGDLTAASGITEAMLDSLLALKDLEGIDGLPPLSEIEDIRFAKSESKSSMAEIERKKQEEIAKTYVRQVDDKGRAYGTGRRKCSIARVWIQPGDGKFLINDKQFDVYFPSLDNRADLLRPFVETKTLGLWDVTCTVKGGGVSGQVGAIRLGISRALQSWEPGLRPYLRSAGFLTRDPRVVERKKPGKAKARKSFQWVKR